ncbi:DNRLRE domain-containing protein [Candidatus Margulisiibacteriota bacterium]
MKKIAVAATLLVLIAAGSLVLLSCGEKVDDSGNKTVSGLTVSPSQATVEVYSGQVFSSIASYTDGTSGYLSSSWSVTGDVGTAESIGLNGLFTATASGSGTVVAQYGGHFASAIVDVIPSSEATGEVTVLATIEVSPANIVIKVGESQVFGASGLNTSSESMAISPSWSLVGDAIGTLTASGTVGTFEAAAQGSAVIVVTSGEVTGRAYVTVEGYVTTVTAETDTFVTQESTAQGSSLTLKAGRLSGVVYETYIKYDLAFIPTGSTIEVATLKLYCSSSDGAAMNLGLLASSFSDATTWETRPSLEAFVLSHAFSPGSNDIDFKDGVQKWIDATNNGLMVYLDDPAVGFAIFVSEDETVFPARRPQLYLEYLTP